MKTRISVKLISFVTFIFGCILGFSQEFQGDSLEKTPGKADSMNQYAGIRELLFIRKALIMAKQDNPRLFYCQNREIASFSLQSLYYHKELFYMDEGWNKSVPASGFIREKIDVSNRKTLDYKKLSEQYPKRGAWESAGLLLFEVVTKSYIDSKVNSYPGH